MSRGRGEAGRGGARGESYRIAGFDLPWDPDLAIDDPKPTPLYPKYKAPQPAPLSKDEKTHVARFRSLRTSIHEGPLYTVLGSSARVSKTTTSLTAQFDAFEGMPTYSQKYAKKRRRIPKLDTRPYVFKFFPKELWSTLDPTHAMSNGVDGSMKGKKLQLSDSKKADGQASGRSKGAVDQLANGDEDDEMAEHPADEDAQLDEDVDDEYDEDEDEGGDYDAEAYFDDGGDDVGEDYDAGEADGGEY